ncbi:MAG: haloacid dehalogenase type II [Actinomycetota bacterium]|nr:haloacid dehalogenase type II [Actinomycetota bacterium]
MSTPSVVVFDVNETLSDLAPMQQRFAEVGAPGLAAQGWFASVLRDGFALTAAGSTERFSTLAAGALRTILVDLPLSRDPDAAVEHIMGGFLELPVHPDVPDGVRALSASGARLVTLSNGSTEVAERLFTAAGIRDHFERLLSVEGAGVWKPAPAAYAYAASTCSVDPGDMLLVAVHPWDIDGAKRAGLRTAWVNRRGRLYPGYFLAPDHSIAALSELAGVVG